MCNIEWKKYWGDRMDWEKFLDPYRQAVEELKIKLKGLRRQFEIRGTHSAIEFVTGRVKPVPSIAFIAFSPVFVSRSFIR